jgi:hypothetical protein
MAHTLKPTIPVFVVRAVAAHPLADRFLHDIAAGCVRRIRGARINTKDRPMQFLILMIPEVYRDNKKLDPGFVPDPKSLEMARFNEELGKAVKILSLNGLYPLSTGARV